ISACAGDHKERDTIADFRNPARLLVESGFDSGLRRVVPQQAVAFVRHKKRHAEAGSSRSEIVGPAMHGMTTVIEKALLVLSEAVVVFVVRRSEGGADHIELGIARP